MPPIVSWFSSYWTLCVPCTPCITCIDATAFRDIERKVEASSYPRKATKLSLDGSVFGWVCNVFVHALQFVLSQPKSTVICFVILYGNFFLYNDGLWVKGWALAVGPLVLLSDYRTKGADP